MTHDTLDDAQRELLALHALGALAPADTAALARHLADDECGACRDELASLGVVVDQMGFAVAPAAPRPGLRERVLAEAHAGRTGLDTVRAHEGEWHPFAPGDYPKHLAGKPATRPSASNLVRLEPGARLRTHAHGAVEHCIVLSGDLHVGDLSVGAGDYHRAGVGTVHQEMWTEHGCLFHIVEAAA